jgi:hypothetical protein
MHRARTIAAISKAAEHLPLVELARVLVRLDHFIIADNLSKAGWDLGLCLGRGFGGAHNLDC